MWQAEHFVITDATPEQIWRVWAAVEQWPAWDSSVQWCKISQSFAAGSQFQLKPAGGPVSLVTITQLQVHKSFTTTSKLPGAVMEFAHVMQPIDENLMKITHTIKISGPLSFLFRWLIGKKLARHLPEAMEKMLSKV